MELLEVEALVIDKLDIGESDRIITLFDKTKGKIKVLIKGIRKSKNREIYATDPLVIGNYKLKKKGDIYLSDSINIKNPFLGIKSNFFKLEISLYILKLINKIVFEDMSAEKLYKISVKALEYIERVDDKNRILIMLSYFIYKIICYEGLTPQFEGENYFSYENNKIENEKSKYSIELNSMEYIYIQMLNKVDIEGINGLKLSNYELLKIINILENYLNYNLLLELDIFKHLREEK